MSTSHLRLIATVAVIAAAALTGAVTGLLGADSTTFDIPLAGAGFAGALVAGGVVVGLLGGRLQPATVVAAEPAPGPAPAPGPDASALAAIDQLNTERRALIDTCIYVRDRATSRAIADKIGAGLNQAGIATVSPVGERFDPTRHEAGGTTPATDATQDGIIAAVETVGYADRTAVLRNPIVTVYRNGGA